MEGIWRLLGQVSGFRLRLLDPSIQITPTLGPKVRKYDLHWAIWIPRESSKLPAGKKIVPVKQLSRDRRLDRSSLRGSAQKNFCFRDTHSTS